MHGLTSYSLRDLLLYSRDTYAFLLQEFIGDWIFLYLLAGIVFFIGLYWLSRTVKTWRCHLLVDAVLLLSLCFYYLAFYRQINAFAIHFAVLIFLQLCLYLLALNRLATSPPKLKNESNNNTAICLVAITTIVLITPGLLELAFTSPAIPVIPIIHPLPSLTLLVVLLLLRKNLPAYLLFIPALLLIVETITSQLLGTPIWWLGITYVTAIVVIRKIKLVRL